MNQPVRAQEPFVLESFDIDQKLFITPDDVPYKFKEIRTLRKLTLRELENKSGISNAYLSQLENGKIKNPSFDVVWSICLALDIQITIN